MLYLVDFIFINVIFPNSVKIAKVIPMHKPGSKQVVENYRTISLLSPFSKIVEKIIKTKLANFLNNNKILYKRQNSFCISLWYTRTWLQIFVNSKISLQKIQADLLERLLPRLIYFLYVNDLHNALLFKLRWFTDDILLFHSSKNLERLETLGNIQYGNVIR